MLITDTGRFFWPTDMKHINDEVFTGRIILMTHHGQWKFWEWDLNLNEVIMIYDNN